MEMVCGYVIRKIEKVIGKFIVFGWREEEMKRKCIVVLIYFESIFILCNKSFIRIEKNFLFFVFEMWLNLVYNYDNDKFRK